MRFPFRRKTPQVSQLLYSAVPDPLTNVAYDGYTIIANPAKEGKAISDLEREVDQLKERFGVNFFCMFPGKIYADRVVDYAARVGFNVRSSDPSKRGQTVKLKNDPQMTFGQLSEDLDELCKCTIVKYQVLAENLK